MSYKTFPGLCFVIFLVVQFWWQREKKFVFPCHPEQFPKDPLGLCNSDFEKITKTLKFH